MKKRLLLLVIGLLALALPGTAMSVQMFDFYGMALLGDEVGETTTMYGFVRDFATPLPLDFDLYEYTLVITDLRLDSTPWPDAYSNGTITIYRDDVTAADYSNPGTFTNGTAILSGVIVTLPIYRYSFSTRTTRGDTA